MCYSKPTGSNLVNDSQSATLNYRRPAGNDNEPSFSAIFTAVGNFRGLRLVPDMGCADRTVEFGVGITSRRSLKLG